MKPKLKPETKFKIDPSVALAYYSLTSNNRMYYPLNTIIENTIELIKADGNILVFYSEDYGNDFAVVYAHKGAVIEQGELATCYTLPIYGVAQCLIDGSILWRNEGLTWLEAIEKHAEAMKGHIGYYE